MDIMEAFAALGGVVSVVIDSDDLFVYRDLLEIAVIYGMLRACKGLASIHGWQY